MRQIVYSEAVAFHGIFFVCLGWYIRISEEKNCVRFKRSSYFLTWKESQYTNCIHDLLALFGILTVILS